MRRILIHFTLLISSALKKLHGLISEITFKCQSFNSFITLIQHSPQNFKNATTCVLQQTYYSILMYIHQILKCSKTLVDIFHRVIFLFKSYWANTTNFDLLDQLYGNTWMKPMQVFVDHYWHLGFWYSHNWLKYTLLSVVCSGEAQVSIC